MPRKTPIDKLADAISDILEEYAGEIEDNVEEIVEQLGKKGAQAMRAKSREAFPRGTGEYAKGWKSQVNRERLHTTAVIYNDHPALPHLLEYGHVTRNGTGRVFPDTPAHEHIAPVAEELGNTFEREVLNRL